MITKKDFKAIAEIFRDEYNRIGSPDITSGAELSLDNVVSGLCVFLRTTNPRFKSQTFRAACYPEQRAS